MRQLGSTHIFFKKELKLQADLKTINCQRSNLYHFAEILGIKISRTAAGINENFLKREKSTFHLFSDV